ncbi:hypothetical protein RD110_08600 [Rhodoferax koreense]|uniref:Response regulatory domain-containing protein n=1 Tax=Rhodoferax koreensis TaxID=1842727 RepID=A0A1P8JU17_9BURK|nr:response regulator [Rhodoferax koreense]APW37247.1 hypothetical protein RD110_08600 [Rhodoferax koreense]
MANAAGVLLVEDDPALVRFFRLATEDLGITLRVCATVAEAIVALEAEPSQLIITDLMLPGESGLVLLQRLQQTPRLRAGARLAVCSAGITAQVQGELAALGAWRQMHKPVSVQAVRDCVQEGLRLPVEEASAGSPPGDGADAWVNDEAAAVARYFAGNLALFTSFRESCLAQFPVDMESGDTALAARDAAAFRRVNHTLKSVLLSLGMTQASDCARRLELAAAEADWREAEGDWARLRGLLLSLVRP